MDQIDLMTQFVNGLITSGPIGTVLAFFMLIFYKMSMKLLTVIDNNTAAMSRGDATQQASTRAIEKNTKVLIELKAVQSARRQEFGDRGQRLG